MDTANKRFSVFALGGLPWHVLPVPDGSFNNAADRAHLAYMYAGIALAEPAVDEAAEGATWHLLARGSTWTQPPRGTEWELQSRGSTWTPRHGRS